MADTNNTQKFFLDLSGLTTLWNKIKSTFADKAATEASITNIGTEIAGVKTSITGLGNEIDGLENTVLTFAPKEADNYTKAIAMAGSLSVGTVIDVKNAEKIENEDGTSTTYGSGLYIVESTNPVSIKFLSTSTGSDSDSGIDGLNVRVENLEKDVIKSAVITDGTNQIGTYGVANNVLLVAHDDTFDINSSSVRALTHRALAAKFKTLETLISGIPKFKVAVVENLPTTGISLSTIYLVKNTVTSTDNLYTEYIYVETTPDDPDTEASEAVYKWEKLGEQSLEVSNFVTQAQLSEAITVALKAYMTSEDIKTYVQEQLTNAKNDVLSTVEKTYAKQSVVTEISGKVDTIEGKLDTYLLKDEAATTYLTKTDASKTYLSQIDAESKGWMTEGQIITSIKEGNIGTAIAITDTQIENITNPQE